MDPDRPDWQLSQELLDALIIRSALCSDPELQQEIEFLRERIPLVHEQKLTCLIHLDSGAEATVFVHPDQLAVYKLVRIHMGLLRGGLHPCSVKLVHNQPWIETRKPTLFDYIRRIDLNNRHGGLVFTEIAAVTSGGQLVVKQPYVPGAFDSTPAEARALVYQLQLLRIRSHDGESAMAEVEGQAVVFDDLHARNLLQTSEGLAYIVDAASEVVTAAEADLIKRASLDHAN